MATGEFDTAFKALDPSFASYTFHAMATGSSNASSDCGAVAAGAQWTKAEAYEALAVAKGGVFENACDYNVGMLFGSLLNRIQEVALACEYDIPVPPDGQVFDRDKVNVDYDDGFGIQTIGFVETVDGCNAVANGWYYDENLTPEQILMCPQTCARFDVLQQASIEIRFGCTTIPAG